MSDKIFRILAYFRHQITATNTLGHGIHSPYLYNLVRMIIYDDNSYYCFSRIEHERQRLLSCCDKIYVTDFGTGKSGERVVADIAASALESTNVAQLIFRVANSLTNRSYLELGTCLGLTTAYLASTGSNSRVVTFEGSAEEIKIARGIWKSIDINNVEVIEGDISITLPQYIHSMTAPFGLAFVDANHTKDATLRYFDLLAGRADESSIVVIDDIHHSQQMQSAWEIIKCDRRVTATIDCFACGMVFFNRSFEKKTYKIRI